MRGVSIVGPRQFYRRCVDIRQTIGDLEGLAISWLNLGEAALFSGDLAEADRCCGRSLSLYQGTDDQYGLGLRPGHTGG